MLSNLLMLVLCTVWREHAHMSEWQMTLLTAWLTSELLSSLLDNPSSLEWTIVHDDLWAPLGAEHFALNHLSGARKVLRGTLETVLVFWTLTHIHHDHSGFGSFLLLFVPFNAPLNSSSGGFLLMWLLSGEYLGCIDLVSSTSDYFCLFELFVLIHLKYLDCLAHSAPD